ncbi:unnamed protein product, partial [Musa acuminata subsp. burmannicoides]
AASAPQPHAQPTRCLGSSAPCAQAACLGSSASSQPHRPSRLPRLLSCLSLAANPLPR